MMETAPTSVEVPTYAEFTAGLAEKVSDVKIGSSSIVTNGIATIPVRSNIVSGSNDLVTSNAVNTALTVMFGTTSA